MKEALRKMMDEFDWVAAIRSAAAITAVVVGIVSFVLALATANAWWLLLWIIPVVCVGIVGGTLEVY